jgi:hypothetical protein
MAQVQVWDDKVHLFMGEVIYAHFYVYADWPKVDSNLEKAFQIQATIRVGGIQFWDTGIVPLANGPFNAKPEAAVSGAVSLPTVQGEIDDWTGIGTDGKPAPWSTATLLTFLVSSKADAAVPVTTIIAALKTLGPAGAAAATILAVAGLFGTKVRLTLGHTNAALPLHRDASGRIAQINHVSAKVPAHA